LARRVVPALAAGGSDGATISLALPASLAAGSYYVVEMVDAGLTVLEATETNNTRASGVIKVGPDLTVTSLTGPSSVTRGGAVTMTDTTRNQGGGAAPATTTRYYLSTNATFDAADIALGARNVGPLSAGGHSQGSTPLVIPAATAAGTYYVIARCDDSGTVGETAENNNTRATTLKVNP
jgi:subtilase family serine protease